MDQVAKTIRPHVIAWVVFLSIGFILFPSSGRDDAHISFFAAQQFADNLAVTNLNHEAVEQSSSLTWVLTTGTISRFFGINIIDSSYWLSIAFGLLTLSMTGLLIQRSGLNFTVTRAAICATCLPPLYWAFGAMETSLAAALFCSYLLCLIQLTHRANNSIHGLAVCVGSLYLMCRPEAGAVLLALFVGFLTLKALRQQPAQALYIQALLLTVVGLILLGARFLYFGDWLPQPVAAKGGVRPFDGINYLIFVTKQWPPLVVYMLAIVFALLYQIKRIPAAIDAAISAVAAQIAFVLFSGGDWMEGGRFLVSLVPAALCLFFFSLSLIKSRTYLNSVIGAAFVLNVCGLIWFAQKHSTAIPLLKQQDCAIATEDFAWAERRNKIHLRDIPAVQALQRLLSELPDLNRPVTIGSNQGGMVAFHIFSQPPQELRFVDFSGLITRDVTACDDFNAKRISAGGVHVWPQEWIDASRDKDSQCELETPDIIFNLDNRHWEHSTEVEKRGYKVIFKQTAQLGRKRTWLSGSRESGNQYIAIHPDLDSSVTITSEQFSLNCL